MIKILSLIAISLISNFICSGQENDDLYYSPTESNAKLNLKTIPKGTWKILIHTNKNKEDNYQLIGETLIEENFQIDKANKDFFTISTVSKAHDRLNFSYILNFVAKDSLIILTGTYKINVTVDFGTVKSDFDFEKIINESLATKFKM